MNVEELESYAKLVELGTPDFIEIKVTVIFLYCTAMHIYYQLL